MRPALLAVFVLLAYATCAAAWTESSYRAGVVEYFPVMARRFNVSRDVALGIMHQNVDAYERFMIEAAKSGTDILVFPEYGLYGPNFPKRNDALPFLEPIPNAGANPCVDHALYPYLNITHRLSCLALAHKITISVDMGDVQHCTKWDHDCPSDGRYQFNTLVVFGETGEILGKYHKTNLYFEPEFDVPVNQHPVAFDLFGVRFGMMICFDVMFAKPQVEMLHRYGVTDLIYSSWWVNTPPILTATQVQQGWSRAFGLNMLASNSGFNERTSGSGIFSQGIALTSFTNPTKRSQNRLLIADVPKLRPRAEDPNTPQLPLATRIPKEELLLAKPLVLHSKILRTWDASSIMMSDEISVDGLTCSVMYQLVSNSTKEPLETLRSRKPTPLSAHSNLPSSNAQPLNQSLILYAASGYLTPLFPAKACGIATCPSDDAQNCITLLQRPGQSLIANETMFSFVNIKAHFTADTDRLTVYPVSAKNEGALFTESELTYSKSAKDGIHALTTPQATFEEQKSVTLLHVGFLARNLETAK